MTSLANIPKPSRFKFESLRHAFEIGRAMLVMKQQVIRRKIAVGWDDAEAAKPVNQLPTLDEIKQRAIDERLLMCGGNVNETVRSLKIAHSTFYHRRKRSAVALALCLCVSAVNGFAQLIPVQSLAAAPAPVQPNGAKGAVTLYWTPATDATVTGYALSYGTNASALNQSVGVGLKTNVTLRGLLESSVYHFSLVSLNTNDISSSEVKTNAFVQPKIEVETYVRRMSVRLATGRTNIVQASSNLTTWTNILTNTTGGIVTWLRTNQTAEFYRVKPN